MEPVFIGGCSRSGTTLLGAMLGAGPQCLATPESPFKIHPLAASVERNRGSLSRTDVERVARDWFLATWDIGVPVELLARAVTAETKEDKREPDSVLLALQIGSSDGRLSPTVGGAYQEDTAVAKVMKALLAAYAVKAAKPGFGHWIDHTPANIRYASTLLEHFPSARFIHLVRDGRAVAASVMRLDWGPNTAKEAARWWTSYVAYGLAAEQALPTGRIVRVRFEDLILRTRETLEAVCDSCQIPFDEAMPRAGGFRVPAYTAAQHRLVGGPLRKDRVESWQTELSPREQEIFEYYTGEALVYLGYPLRYGLQVVPPSVAEKWRMEIREVVKRSVNKCYFAWRKTRYAA
jgi:hypothetical protein